MPFHFHRSSLLDPNVLLDIFIGLSNRYDNAEIAMQNYVEDDSTHPPVAILEGMDIHELQ